MRQACFDSSVCEPIRVRIPFEKNLRTRIGSHTDDERRESRLSAR